MLFTLLCSLCSLFAPIQLIIQYFAGGYCIALSQVFGTEAFCIGTHAASTPQQLTYWNEWRATISHAVVVLCPYKVAGSLWPLSLSLRVLRWAHNLHTLLQLDSFDSFLLHQFLCVNIFAYSVVNWGEIHLMTLWQAVILVANFVWICFASLGIKILSLFRESAALIEFKSKKENKHLVRTYYFVIIATWSLLRYSKQGILLKDFVNVWPDTF